MSQKISINDAHDNFSELVQQVAECDEAIVITNHGQPYIVMIRWETYQ